MSIAEKLLPEFDREFSSTRKFLALIPDDKISWKPHAKSMELGRLASHISDFSERAYQVLTQPERVVTPEELAQRRDAWKSATRESIVSKFDGSLQKAHDALASMPDAKWDTSWKLVFSGRTVFDGPRGLAYRNIVVSHMIHHRAQLGLYLRLNDIAIPGTYGPSADEQ
ncbi:MAG TPA: DinB family protein [Acidobacteriaceae bacterium]|nr:DinB family protein [Acidobacteriaceae bacterium]